MSLFDKPQVDVTLSIRVYDVRAFVRAARKRAVEEGASEDDARATYRATDLGACARMLFDPGSSPPGCEILDSSSETY